jgi:hypothetical protein
MMTAASAFESHSRIKLERALEKRMAIEA